MEKTVFIRHTISVVKKQIKVCLRNGEFRVTTLVFVSLNLSKLKNILFQDCACLYIKLSRCFQGLLTVQKTINYKREYKVPSAGLVGYRNNKRHQQEHFCFNKLLLFT